MSERLTDDEIAEIRRGATAHDRTWPYRAIRALLAEIDALRAERDAAEDERNSLLCDLTDSGRDNKRLNSETLDLICEVRELQERLAETEALLPDLRPLLREYDRRVDEATNAEARIAAVEAMCDRAEADRESTNALFTSAVRAALRGESAPNPQPAPCATCGGRGEVCRLCGPMPRGAACLDHHYEEGVPCPSCSVSPGSETP